MEKFFEKYIDEYDEYDAIKLIDKKVDKAKEKAKSGDPTYKHCLAEATEMLLDFFESMGVNYKTLL